MIETVASRRHPSRRCVVAGVLVIALALLPVFLGPVYVISWLLGVVLLCFGIGYDLAFGARPRDLRIRFFAAKECFVGRIWVVQATFADAKKRPRRLFVGFDVSPTLVAPEPHFIQIGAASTSDVEFEFVAKRRGPARLLACWIRYAGPCGLIHTTETRTLRLEGSIVPDVRRARDEALAFLSSPAFETTERRSRWIGHGTQFHALREFFVGGDTRLIDWKSSARHRKLLMREFHEERNHQIVLAIDTGRLMDEPIDGVPRLDRAVVAALSLAVVALRSSDRVGLYGFDAKARIYVEPAAGRRAWHALRRATADLEYSTAETNFTLGITELSTRLKRRSLVVVFTDFVDSVTAELMVEHVSRLARKHVVIFVALADPMLRQLRAAEPTTLTTVHEAIVADDLLRDRAIVLRTLERAGVHVIDARWQSVSLRLLDSYLTIRRRELVG